MKGFSIFDQQLRREAVISTKNKAIDWSSANNEHGIGK